MYHAIKSQIPIQKIIYYFRSLNVKVSNPRRSADLQGAHAISVVKHPLHSFPKMDPVVCLKEK